VPAENHTARSVIPPPLPVRRDRHHFVASNTRAEFSAGREAWIAAHFDDDLVAFFEGKLPQRALKRADVAPSPVGPGASARDLRRQWRLSCRRWRGYVKAWERLAALVKPAARPALVQRLTLQRLYRCLWTPATREQPRVLDKFAKQLRRVSGCTKEEAAAIRAELGSMEAFETRLGQEP